jgi:hypothetical protein
LGHIIRRILDIIEKTVAIASSRAVAIAAMAPPSSAVVYYGGWLVDCGSDFLPLTDYPAVTVLNDLTFERIQAGIEGRRGPETSGDGLDHKGEQSKMPPGLTLTALFLTLSKILEEGHFSFIHVGNARHQDLVVRQGSAGPGLRRNQPKGLRIFEGKLTWWRSVKRW